MTDIDEAANSFNNLRFYADMAVQFDWHTDIIDSRVIFVTLNEIANRFSAAQFGAQLTDDYLREVRKLLREGKTQEALSFLNAMAWLEDSQ